MALNCASSESDLRAVAVGEKCRQDISGLVSLAKRCIDPLRLPLLRPAPPTDSYRAYTYSIGRPRSLPADK